MYFKFVLVFLLMSFIFTLYCILKIISIVICSAVPETGVQFLGLGRSAGEGNDSPLQYSYLGNPIDRGGWWLHEVTNVDHNLASKLSSSSFH